MILWKCLSSKQERIILQALKLLTMLSCHDSFREQLFGQKEVFNVLKEISVSTNSFETYEIEIQTALCECLDKITKVAENENLFTVPIQNQINQIKIFNKYLINLAIQKEYVIERTDERKRIEHSMYDI